MAGWLVAALALSSGARPNILFMMADQLRYDAIGAAGNSAARTPNLDRLAAEGMRVAFSWSSTPTCTPARAGILTGRSPWNHGMLGYGQVAPRYAVEMPRVMSAAGYTTHSIGKDHFGWNATVDGGISHGYNETELYDGLGSWDPNAPATHWSGEFDNYDRWFANQMPGKDPQATLDRQGAAHGGANDGWNGWHGAPYVYDEFYHPTAWVGRQAVNFLRQANSSSAAPFLLKVSFHRPHSPYDPPKRVLDKFDPSKLPQIYVSNASDGAWDTRFRGLPNDPSGCGPKDADAWCGLMPTNMSDISRIAYYGSVAFVDEQVGAIYSTLVESSLLENTYILWTADHGDGQGDHYHWRKGYPYEFSAHVPMLLRWPESEVPSRQFTLPRGSVITPPIVTELRDVFHTVVDAGHAISTVPNGAFVKEDGKSLLCLLVDSTGKNCDYQLNPGPWRSWIDLEHSTCYNESNHWNALTDGRMKYIFRAFFGDEQLFNLTSDPHELDELSQRPEYAIELQLWRSRLISQFEMEGRGSDWVSNGKLQRRTQGQTYSPNYPRGPPAKPPIPGTRITLAPNGAIDDQWSVTESSIKLQSSQNLCLADGGNSTLIVALCSPGASSQKFDIVPQPSVSGRFLFQQIIHTPTKRCVTALKKVASLTTCIPTLSDNQLWVDGQSGRLCADKTNSLCLTASPTSWRAWEALYGTLPEADLLKY